MTKTTKVPSVKARVMYAPDEYPRELETNKEITCTYLADERTKAPDDAPYYLLPADAESYDAMVEQMAKATFTYEELAGAGYVSRTCEVGDLAVRSALTAIGIIQPRRTASGRKDGAK